MKSWDIKAQGNLLVGERIDVPGRWCTLTPQEQKLLSSEPLETLPCVSLHPAVHLCNRKYSTFLSSVNHFSESLNLRCCGKPLICS